MRLCIAELRTAILFAAPRYISTSFSHILAVKPNLMKRSLFALIFFAAFSTDAQDRTGMYLAPSVGICVGGIKGNALPPDKIYADEAWAYKPGIGFKLGILAGYQWSRCSVNTGVVFLAQWIYGSVSPSSTYSVAETIQLDHLLFPLTISSRIKLQSKGHPRWLMPAAGIEIGRIIGCKVDYKETALTNAAYPSGSPGLFSGGYHDTYSHVNLTPQMLNMLYRRTTVWLITKFDLEVVRNKRHSLTVGPEIHYMCSNLSKVPEQSAQSYTLAVNIGYKSLWR